MEIAGLLCFINKDVKKKTFYGCKGLYWNYELFPLIGGLYAKLNEPMDQASQQPNQP